MYSKVLCGTLHGVEGRLIVVEADVSEGLPVFNMVGFLASEVKESSDRVRTAIKNSGYRLKPQRITINLSPADIRKEGSAFDLSISIALLSAFGYIPEESLKDVLILGELSLNGDIRPVKGVLSIVDFAAKEGIKNVILPYDNRKEGAVIPNINIFYAKKISEVVDHFMGVKELSKEPYVKMNYEMKMNSYDDFSDVKGQIITKRALEIAVTGMHNILMMGPPGSGKSMLAKRIPSIMPPLTYEESIEITKIYSSNGLLDCEEGLINTRPFRMPHHSITASALIGGGRVPKPGEISLAHNGVLFMDEFLEYNRDTIEMMRQPMEDRKISITRLNGSYVFPCDFMLVAAMNPCPCGYYPDLKKCHCSEPEIKRYRNKISYPMLDRMDICINVQKIEYDDLYSKCKEESSELIRRRVLKGIAIQKKRFKGMKIHFNSQIPDSRLEEFCKLMPEEEQLRKEIYNRYNLSARGLKKLLKLARTIADLDASDYIHSSHMLEALSYRNAISEQAGEL